MIKDVIIDDETLSKEESNLLISISNLARVIANIGFGYAVFITSITLYQVLSVAYNSKMWSYYKTIPGFINILVIIFSGFLYWFVSMQMLRFGQHLKHSLLNNKQYYFESAWRHLNRFLLVLDSMVILIIIASWILSFARNF